VPPSWNVFWKETLSFFRDRRTVFNQIVLPLFLMPVFMFAPTYLMARLGTQAGAEVQRVAVKGAPEELLAALRAERLAVLPSDDPATAVRRGKAEVGLLVQGRKVLVFAKKSQEGFKAEVVLAKVDRALSAYKRARVEAALRAAGLDPSVLEPFTREVVDVSPKAAQAAGALGFLVPMFLLMFIVTGAMPVVIDATAGEKEKGTLEVLLAAPAPLVSVLLGKAGAAMVAALVSTLSGVLGLAFGGALLLRLATGPEVQALGFRLAPGPLGVIAVTGVLFAAFAVSAMILLGLYAKSYKEAQTYVSPLYMVLVVPLLVLMFASDFLSQNLWLYALPVFNVYLAIDQIIKAQIGAAALLVTWLSSLIYVAAATYWASRNFSDEGVLFRN
jgi:sodium transport system permease protein